MTEKQEIPAPPFPVEPRNNAGFDIGEYPMIELAWRGRPRRGTVHLQVSRSKSFDSEQLDVDAPRLAKDSARLRLVAAGTYFWRLETEGAAPQVGKLSLVR